MELILQIVVGIIILVILVVAHEAGHAIAASRNGVEVEEFGIGFPPRFKAWKLKSGMIFSLNILPVGGFVRLKGELESSTKKGDYGAATFSQKTKILFAGVFANWIIAALLLSTLALFGLPKVISNQFSAPGDTITTVQPVEIADVTKNYPAQKAGLQTGDLIIRFADKEVSSVQKLLDLEKQNKGKTISVIYNREGAEHTVQVKLRNSSSAVFGASLGQREFTKSTWSAPLVGVVTTAQFSWATIQGLGDLVYKFFSGIVLQFSPDAAVRKDASSNLQTVSDSFAGPVGILGTIFPSAEQAGIVQLTMLTAIIAISLAVMNILPVPALDGGRWIVGAIYKLRNKKLTEEREERIQMVGFVVLMSLVVLITISDVAKII